MKKCIKRVIISIIIVILSLLTLLIVWILINIHKDNENNITINVETYNHDLLEINDNYLFVSENSVCVYNGSSTKEIFPINNNTLSVLLSSTSEYIFIVENFLSTSTVTKIDNYTHKIILQSSLNNIITDILAEGDSYYTIENSKLIFNSFNGEDYSGECIEIDNNFSLDNSVAIDFRLKSLSYLESENGKIIKLTYVNDKQEVYFIRNNDSMVRISDSIWLSVYNSNISLFFQNGNYVTIDIDAHNISEKELVEYLDYSWFVEDCAYSNDMFLLKNEVCNEKFGHMNNITKSNGSVVCLYDSLTGNCFWRKEFQQYEKCIYISYRYIVTYYNNKYHLYSYDKLNIEKEYDATEIKNGGSYTFEACRDYIFVFDDYTGEMINTIKV